MRVHDQARALAVAASDALGVLDCLRAQVHRKCAAPYPDGSRSNLVNADSDVLPDVGEAVRILSDALHRCGGAS